MLKNKTNKEINGIILILFIYLKYICSLILLGNTSIAEVITKITTCLMIVCFFYKNKFYVSKKNIFLILLIFFIYLINSIFVPYKYYILKSYIEFLAYNLIVILTIFNGINYKATLYFWHKLSKILVLITAIILIFKLQGSMNYMFIGIYNSYNSLIIAYHLFNSKQEKKTNFLLLSISLIIALYGNRSALITIVVGISILFITRNEKKSIKKIIIDSSLIIVSIFTLIKIDDILKIFIQICEKFNINSYSIRKIAMMLEQGLMASASGRDNIYDITFDIIVRARGLPTGVGYLNYVTGHQYPHNFILEWFLVFGYLFGTILLMVLVAAILNFLLRKNIDNSKKTFMILFLIYFITRSLFSSSFLIERSFWIVIIIILSKNDILKDDFHSQLC